MERNEPENPKFVGWVVWNETHRTHGAGTAGRRMVAAIAEGLVGLASLDPPYGSSLGVLGGSSGEDVVDDVAVDVGEAEVAAADAVGQAFVVEAE